MKGKKYLISYSWNSDKKGGTEEHKNWVIKLAKDLRKNGVDVILDEWDMKPGDTMSLFMERSITKSERVLCILTPAYKDKCDNRTNGAGYEAAIITSEILQNVSTNKFIPVLRSGDWNKSAPIFLRGRMGIDMREDDEYKEKLIELLKALLNYNPKPDLGEKPVF